MNTELGTCVLRSLDVDSSGETVVQFDQHIDTQDSRSAEPMALIPQAPPDDFYLQRAIHDLATTLIQTSEMPGSAILDLLAQRSPRLSSRMPLPRASRRAHDLVTAIQDLDNSFLAVQGPPGTGKTRLGASAVRRLVNEGWRIGVVAQSHAAVEHFLDTAIDQGLESTLVGKKASGRSNPTATWRRVNDVPDFVNSHKTGCLVGGTVWTFANPMLRAGALDLLVIEEAGQLSIAHTMAASRAGRNLLLLGDPQQLPGVSEGVHDEPVDDSPLGWLTQGLSVLPEQYGYFLDESFRMNPAVCRRVSDLAYDGRLISSPVASQRSMVGVDPGVVRVEVDHLGNFASSLEEAEEVTHRVTGLLGKKWFDPSKHEYAVGLREQDFLIVAPFNAQVNLIRECLASSGLTNVRVGTVDRFQGQEAPVVLISMASSSLEYTPRSGSFLLDVRRLNVAISRAQWLAMIVCSTELTRRIPTNPDDLVALATFARLADQSVNDDLSR